MSLPTAALGHNGPQVNRVGFGLMGLSVAYGQAKPDAERLEVLDKAYEMGAHFWDSSDYYGDSEELLGRWFKANPNKRKDIFLATKFGAKALFTTGEPDSSPENCKKSMTDSLERLGLPYVDLYYCHRLDKQTPIEKTVQAMVELKNEGKIKYLGLSECSSDSLRRAHAVHPISAVQVEYSAFALEIESEQIGLLKTARELGVAVVCYSPLNRGMLTGALKSPDDFEENDVRRIIPRFSKENFPKNLELVEKFGNVAKSKGFTTGQVALAWLMAQGEDIFPIPGTTRVERLRENIGSCNVKLSNEEVTDLRRAVNDAEVAGARYPDSFMKDTYVDTPPL